MISLPVKPFPEGVNYQVDYLCENTSYSSVAIDTAPKAYLLNGTNLNGSKT